MKARFSILKIKKSPPPSPSIYNRSVSRFVENQIKLHFFQKKISILLFTRISGRILDIRPISIRCNPSSFRVNPELPNNKLVQIFIVGAPVSKFPAFSSETGGAVPKPAKRIPTPLQTIPTQVR